MIQCRSNHLPTHLSNLLFPNDNTVQYSNSKLFEIIFDFIHSSQFQLYHSFGEYSLSTKEELISLRTYNFHNDAVKFLMPYIE